MARRISLQGDLFKEYMERLDRLGGLEAMKEGTERALKASKDYVNPLIETAMNKLPARGKYSTGRTKESINSDDTVEWIANVASIKVGFDFQKSGLTSIFLMYGTPRMRPATGLKNAIYGSATQKEIAKIQAEELDKVISEIMRGR